MDVQIIEENVRVLNAGASALDTYDLLSLLYLSSLVGSVASIVRFGFIIWRRRQEQAKKTA